MKVFAASVRAIVAEVVGKVITVLSVPAKVSEFEAVKVFRFVMVRVPVLEVIVKPLILVAVATPKVGVVKVGLVSVLLVKVSVVVFPTKVSVVAGKVRTIPVPAIAFGCKETFPEVEPAKRTTPRVVPARPTSSNAPGAVFPIPTFPPASILTLSKLFVPKIKGAFCLL